MFNILGIAENGGYLKRGYPLFFLRYPYKEDETKAYHVLLEVESDTRKGYASIYVDNSMDIVTLKQDKLCVDLGEKMDFIPGEYLEGQELNLKSI